MMQSWTDRNRRTIEGWYSAGRKRIQQGVDRTKTWMIERDPMGRTRIKLSRAGRRIETYLVEHAPRHPRAAIQRHARWLAPVLLGAVIVIAALISAPPG